MKRRHLRRLVSRTLLALAIIVIALPPLLLLTFRFLPPPATPLMLIRLAEGHGLDYRWRPLGDIAPVLPAAVLAAEDNRFCRHWGIDWQAVEHAWNEFRAGGRLRGASTVSMQTAKNLFLWPGRSWLRKGLEAYLVLWVELLWDKERIIEVYLNIAEFGPGIYGAEAAAQHWFGRPAAALGPLQAARLAVVLPDPLDRSADRPTPRLARIAQTVANRSTQIAPLLDCYN